MDTHSHIEIPNHLLQNSEQFAGFAHAHSLTVEVSPSYLEQAQKNWPLPEVVAIQRLLTLARHATQIRIMWHKRVAERVFISPNLFPLLAVALCLDNTAHELINEDGTTTDVDAQLSRLIIYKHRLQADLFSDTQILLCADSRGQGRPKSLYSSKSSGLIARADFESLVDRLLTGQTAGNASASQAVVFSQNIATVVAELFENTDIHGRFGLDGVPFKANGIRGLVFKRVKLVQKEKKRMFNTDSTVQPASSAEKNNELDALEISVFDSGVGFYSSYTRLELTENTDLDEEWRIMHKCLERHYDKGVPDIRAPHTGMGLYEVLRALIFLKGRLEVRSGRTYGYRTFQQGDPKYQLESKDSSERPGMPKPVLLDVERKYVTVPFPNEPLIGASIRVLIPLQ